MNLKAIKPSYGDFGRVARGVILKDVSRELARKLIAGGAYVEATAVDLKAGEKSPSLAQDRGNSLAAEAARFAEAAAAAEAELEKMTNKQLQELAASEGTAVEGDDNKASLIKKIMASRVAKA